MLIESIIFGSLNHSIFLAILEDSLCSNFKFEYENNLKSIINS